MRKSTKEKPIFRVTLELSPPDVLVEPTADDMVRVLKRIPDKIIESTRLFVRWQRGTCIPCSRVGVFPCLISCYLVFLSTLDLDILLFLPLFLSCSSSTAAFPIWKQFSFSSWFRSEREREIICGCKLPTIFFFFVSLCLSQGLMSKENPTEEEVASLTFWYDINFSPQVEKRRKSVRRSIDFAVASIEQLRSRWKKHFSNFWTLDRVRLDLCISDIIFNIFFESEKIDERKERQ